MGQVEGEPPIFTVQCSTGPTNDDPEVTISVEHGGGEHHFALTPDQARELHDASEE